MAIQYNILVAVKSTIDDLSIPNLTTVIRKDLIVDERDVLPTIVIAPGRPSIESEHTENTIVWMRPVFLCIAEGTGEGRIEADMDTLLSLEDQVRQALHTTSLAGVPSVWDTDISPDSLFIPGGIKAGYDMTIFRVDFLSTEDRSA